jgi:hypothetical protein
VMMGLIVGFVASQNCYAGSDRLIMSMSEQRMDQEDLVYVRFLGSDAAAFESNVLNKMVIREGDCESGRIFSIVEDYKVGYAPKTMLVGIYLFPQAWKDRKLCFGFPGLGRVQTELRPSSSSGRMFEFTVVP